MKHHGNSITQWIFLLTAAVLISLRFLHFGESIDTPHAWRQCDTANYIWAFYKTGIDIFHPQVCWMGGHKTLVLEFPIFQAIIAWFYKLLAPSHIVARLVFLIFYLLSAVYLYRLICFLSGWSLAQISVIIYLSMPLGLFYSRALQIDFATMFLVFGMTFHFLKGINSKNLPQFLLGSLYATMAFLVKAPYIVPLLIPMAWYYLKNWDTKFVVKSAVFIFLPVAFFGLWMNYASSVNGSAPEWNFIPTYRKFVDNSHWYFGPFQQRLNPAFWEKIFKRVLYEVASGPGIILAMIGVFVRGKQILYYRLWLAGVFGYLLIFFNLNVHHNYYQIPFTAPIAILIGVSLLELKRHMDKKLSILSKPMGALLLFIIITYNFSYAEINYYENQKIMELAGTLVKEKTTEEDLIVFSYGGLDPRCPLLLYRARRNGWSIPQKDLNPTLIYLLMKEGASKLAVIRKGPFEGEMQAYTGYLPMQEFRLQDSETLYLYDLDMQYFSKSDNY